MKPNLLFVKPEFRPDGPLPQRPPKIGAAIRSHKSLVALILLFGIAASAALGYQYGTVYSATASLSIAPRFAKILHDDKEIEFQSREYFAQFLFQQVTNVTRHDIMLEAVKNFPDCNVKWSREGETEQQAAERLAKKLIVQPVLDQSAIRVTIKGRKPDGLAEIVNLVTHLYMRRMKSEQIYGSRERIEALSKYQLDLRKQLEAKSAELTSMADKLGAAVFQSVLDNRSTDITISNLTGRRAELIQKISGLSSRNPARVQAELEMSRIEAEINRLAASPEERVRATLLREEIARIQKKLEMASERLDFLTVESQAPGLVRVGSPARPPDDPTKARTLKIVAVGLLGTFALAFFLPVFIDIRDSRIYNAKDLERVLGFPTIGWMPDTSDGWQPEFVKIQRKRLAFAIERARREHSFSVFLLTSVTPGGGCTTLANDVAGELSHLGVKSIAVEVNTRESENDPDARPSAPAPVDPTEIDTLIIPGNKDGSVPDHIPLGMIGAHWPASTRAVTQTLSQLKNAYDVILLDAGPLLLSSDTEHLIGLADATLVVVRAGRVMTDQVRSVAFHLQRLLPKAVGSIVNGVSRDRGIDDVTMAYKEHVTKQSSALARFITRWVWS